MTTTPQRTLDADVAAYVDLTDRIRLLTMQLNEIKDRLRSHGPGYYQTTMGPCLCVSPPRRVFNLPRAWTLLTEEQRGLATSPDPGKVKAFLPAVLVDTCMDEGTGAPVVSIK